MFNEILQKGWRIPYKKPFYANKREEIFWGGGRKIKLMKNLVKPFLRLPNLQYFTFLSVTHFAFDTTASLGHHCKIPVGNPIVANIATESVVTSRNFRLTYLGGYIFENKTPVFSCSRK